MTGRVVLGRGELPAEVWLLKNPLPGTVVQGEKSIFRQLVGWVGGGSPLWEEEMQNNVQAKRRKILVCSRI